MRYLDKVDATKTMAMSQQKLDAASTQGSQMVYTSFLG